MMKEGKYMDIKNKRYVILELIPTSSDPKKGDIAQISALKINKMTLEDRFDYRLDKSKINIPDILKMLDYDNDSFKYVKTTKTIMKKFKDFSEDLPLLIIDNSYTRKYLDRMKNEKVSIFKLMNLEVTDDVFEKLISKYNLQPSNYLVDLMYEALVMELG